MFPWLWVWAPQVHFPWSGSVAQQIEPDLGWFFGAIRPSAGDPSMEQHAFEVATYGRQLGLLTEAVLGGSEGSSVTAAQACLALERLEEIRLEIEALKTEKQTASAEALVESLEHLRRTQPEAFGEIARRVQLQPVQTGV
jgi:hypothetical protein